MKKIVINREEEGDRIKFGIAIFDLFSPFLSKCVQSVILVGELLQVKPTFRSQKSPCKTEFAWAGQALWAKLVILCLALIFGVSAVAGGLN